MQMRINVFGIFSTKGVLWRKTSVQQKLPTKVYGSSRFTLKGGNFITQNPTFFLL